MTTTTTQNTPSRSLEVTTDAPQPPTLAIISPTPRAFTFPVSHNLSDSPYTTPSHSPFEPDQKPLSITCSTPILSSLSLSPSSTTSTPSPLSAISAHIRRKSSTSLDVERRPKKGDEDYVKRPENAFILFRRKCCEDRQQLRAIDDVSDSPTKKQRQADLSKTISQQWKTLSADERAYWEKLAKEKKKEHERLYPDYVYRPQRVRDKDGKLVRKSKKGREHSADGDLTFVCGGNRPHGRSHSAPSGPAPYHTIHVPNVYVTPSCPTSPSLLPMISRRSSHPAHHEDIMSDFDYLPNDHLMPPLFGGAGIHANLQSSELLRSMFNVSNDLPDLAPLTISQELSPMLLPCAQMTSPASSVCSGSSGPSSPRAGPFTPTSGMLFPQLTASDLLDPKLFENCKTEAADPQIVQVQQQLLPEYSSSSGLDFSSYTWDTNWPSSSEVVFATDDFDVNAIPPIELGQPKFPSDLSSEMQFVSYAEPQSHLDDGLLGFDDMMAGSSF